MTENNETYKICVTTTATKHNDNGNKKIMAERAILNNRENAWKNGQKDEMYITEKNWWN